MKDSKGTSFKLTVTHKGYTTYRQVLQSSHISSMVEHDNFQTMYDRWTQTIENTIRQVQTKFTKKNSRIEVRKLCKIKKVEKSTTADSGPKRQEILIARIHLMREHIESQREEAEANRIIKIVRQLNEKIGYMDLKFGKSNGR